MDEKTRKNAVVAWPLFKAIAEGKTIQLKLENGEWEARINETGRFEFDKVEYREVLDLRAMIGELVGDTMRRAFKAGHASDLPEIHRECMAKLKQLFEEQGNRENE